MTFENKFLRALHTALYRNKTSSNTKKLASSPKLKALKGIFDWQNAKSWKENVVKNKYDVFISYSHKDEEFILDLALALKKESTFRTWIDKKDILPSTKWKEEIGAGIVGAHTFIFVISNTSVKSDYCKKEIDYAFTNKKRVIPVVREDVKNELVDPRLRELHWIFLRRTDSYEDEKKRLIDALNTDLEYYKNHARLLVLASHWENNNKDDCFLLYGKEIEAAERWVVDGKQMKPHPTSLHKEYIKASRRSASIRSRNLASIISITALAAVFAGLKSQANSIRSLIESSEGYLASKLPLEARISSIKAAESFNSPFNKLVGIVDGKLEEQLGLNLTHAIYRDQVYNQIETGQRALEAIAMSPSGHLIASTSSKSNEVKLWDIHGKPKGSIQCTQCSRVMFSADGQKLVALNGNNEIIFWDIRSFPTELKNKKFRLTGTSNVYKIAFSANGKRVVALGNDGVIRIWDLWGDHQNPLQELDAYTKSKPEVKNGSDPGRIAVSPDTRYIAVVNKNGVIDLWDSLLNSQGPVHSLPYLSQIVNLSNPGYGGDIQVNVVNQVRFSPDGSMLAAIGDVGSRAVVWSMSDLDKPPFIWKGDNNSFDNIVFTPDGRNIGLVQKGKINWKTIDNAKSPTNISKVDVILNDYEQPNKISSLIFSHDKKHLFIGNDDGTINILNTSSPESDDQPMELEHTLSAPASQWKEHLLSLTGHRFIVWNKENPGKYCLLAMGKDQVCQSLPGAANSEFKTWAFNSQENLFHVTQQKKSLSIIPTPPLNLINSDGYNTILSKSPPAELDLECPNIYTISAAISPTGEIATGGVQSLCLWNSKGGLIKQVPFRGEGTVYQVAYSGNGKVLAVVDSDLGVASTYDSSGAEQAQLPLLGQSSRVALNHDGSRIAIAGKNVITGMNTVKILGSVGQELALFRLPNDVLALSFPSDGLRIAIRSPKPSIDPRNVQFLILKQPSVRSLSSQLCKRSQDYLEDKKMTDLGTRQWT